MPKRASRAATIRSHDSTISKPSATANPSTAAISGLRGGCCVIPPEPRLSVWGRSLRKHARLGLDRLRCEHAPAAAQGGIAANALEVAAELFNRLDRADALDLDGHPCVVAIAAHQVDGPDVGGPFPPHQPEALAAPL